MKRWIHASDSTKQDKHVEYFNEHYSKNVKNRKVNKNGLVYFTYPFPVTRLIKSYNKEYGTKLDVRLEFSHRDEEGRDNGNFVVFWNNEVD